MSAGVPDGSVPAACAQGQAAAPSSAQHVVEAAPVPAEAVPAADEPQASTLAMQHTPADGKVAGQHALPVYLVKLQAVCSIWVSVFASVAHLAVTNSSCSMPVYLLML